MRLLSASGIQLFAVCDAMQYDLPPTPLNYRQEVSMHPPTTGDQSHNNLNIFISSFNLKDLILIIV